MYIYKKSKIVKSNQKLVILYIFIVSEIGREWTCENVDREP